MTNFAIETVALTRRFGSTCVVDGLDLRVPTQSVYGRLVPNGAGKTTTIRMLLGLIRAPTGEIRIGGLSMPGQRMAVLRTVGALVETPSLYPHLTGAENLALTRRLVGIEPRHGLAVHQLIRQPRSLEDVFLTLTEGPANERSL